MPDILADVNVDGQLEHLRIHLAGGHFRQEWLDLGIGWFGFGDLGWNRNMPDDQVWARCQENDLILITGNRNGQGPHSLEATIRAQCGPRSWPVMTISRAGHLLRSRDYADRIVERLMDYLMNIEDYRGAGRLYLP